MNEQTKNQDNKFVKLFKNYGYYFILAFLIVVMAVILVVASSSSNKKENNNNVEPVSTISFTMPVLNASVIKGYNADELQYNAVLNQWEIHKSIDFGASKGMQVLASFGGTVSEIYTNLLEGTVIVIDHGDNLKTVYGSLDSNVNVEVGDAVATGDVIGTASNSATRDIEDSHVHFEVWKDGASVDPAGYLNVESK